MTETIIIVLACFLAYYRTLKFGLIVDDDIIYASRAKGQRKFTWKRPLEAIVDRLYGGHTFGNNLAIDHGFTTALHALTCALIYHAFGASDVSFIAALLYAFNPANNQTAIWLNGRRYQVVIILTLAMMVLGQEMIGLYYLSLFFQLTGFFSPLLLGPSGFGWIGIAAVFLLPKIKDFIESRRVGIVNKEMLNYKDERMIIIVKTFGFYLKKMFFPARTFMVYPFLLEWGLHDRGNKDAYRFDHNFYVGAAGLIAILASLSFLPVNEMRYVLFFLFATLQCSNVFISNQNAADRYVSLPNMVAMYFLAKIFLLFPLPFAEIFITAMMAYYLCGLSITMKMYKDLESYYEYHSFFNPSNHIPRRDLAYRYINAGRPIEALVTTNKALQSNTLDFTTRILHAKALQLLVLKQEARLSLAIAVQNQYDGQNGMHDKTIDELRSLIEDRKEEKP